MKTALVVSLLLGAGAVFQSGLNRKIAVASGLPAAALLNAAIIVCIASFCFILQKYGMSPWAGFKSSSVAKLEHWWYVLPGLIGFCIVVGLPYAMSVMGATRVFVLVIAAQCLASLFWDRFFEGYDWDWTRVLGVGVTLLGALLANLRSLAL